MDDTIVVSGNFGSIMWEYPTDAKEIFKKLQEAGNDAVVDEIKAWHKNNILCLLRMQLGTLHAGLLAPILAANIDRHVHEMAKEGLKLLHSGQ